MLAIAAIITAAFAIGCVMAALPDELFSQTVSEENTEYLKEELSTVITDPTELEELEKYENLKTLDLTGSTLYREIYDYTLRHPEVEVEYTLPLTSEGRNIKNSATEITLTEPEAIAELAGYSLYLPGIKRITLMKSGFSSEDFEALKKAYPEAELLFHISDDLGEISPDTAELDFTGLAPEETENAAGFLKLMPAVEKITLTQEDGTNLLSLGEIYPLEQAAPGADFDYRFYSFNVPVSTMDEVIEYYGNKTGYIYDSGLEEIEEMLPCLPKLKQLYFEFCEIDYDLLASFRERHPEIDVVWRITFGAYSCRTDREMIYADGSLNSDLCYNLRYCNKVKYIDLGHNNLTTIEFAAFMPELEVAIFAAGNLYDISPLASCPNLMYLEIFYTNVKDLTPLENCTKLEHLNISYTPISDLTPLYNLTSLKRMWCARGAKVPKEQQEEIQTKLPDCECFFGNTDSTGAHWRYADDGSKVETYEWLSSIFGYDNWRDYITYW